MKAQEMVREKPKKVEKPKKKLRNGPGQAQKWSQNWSGSWASLDP